MQEFNKIYNTIMEQLNTDTVLDAIKICNNTANPYLKSLEEDLEKTVEKIINSNQIVSSEHLSNVLTIKNFFKSKNFLDMATKSITRLLNIYKDDASILAKIINSKEISYNKLIKFNDLSYDFMTRLFSFLKLNKTTSTANVGRGELILALLIKNATVDGLDDLKINDNNFNVKYISPFRQTDNAMIYYTGQNNSAQYWEKLLPYFKNKTVCTISDYKDQPEFNRLLTELIKSITRGVYGYVLVSDIRKDDNFELRYMFVTSNNIRNNPYKFLSQLKSNNSYGQGIYFNGKILFPPEEN